jgi:fibronectin-binding autotransporter adhesin
MPSFRSSVFFRKKATSTKNLTWRRRNLEELESRLVPATHTWTGMGDGTWSSPANWDSNGAPSATESNVVLIFGSLSAGIQNMVDNIPGLKVDQIDFSASGYNLSASTATVLSLTGVGSPGTGSSAAILDTVGGNTISGTNLSLGLTGASQFSIAGSDTISAAITGTFGVTNVGSGTLTLTSTGTNYSGGTTVSSGTFRIFDTTSFASPMTVTAPGIFEADSDKVWASKWQYTKALTGSGTFNKTGTGYFMLTGAISLSGQINVQAGILGNDQLSAVWTSNTANLDISAGAFFDLRGNSITVNALTGAGTISDSFSNGTALTVTTGIASGSGNFTGAITKVVDTTNQGNFTSGTPVIGVTKVGSGTQTFNGASTYTNSTVITNGTASLTGSLAGTNIYVGFNNLDFGILTINSPATMALTQLVAGQNVGSVGIVNLSQGTLNFSSFFDIGNNGTTTPSTYNQTGGAVNVSGFTYFGNSGTGDIDISGGTFTAKAGVGFDQAGTGSSALTLSGGTFNQTGGNFTMSQTAGSSSTYTQSAGIFNFTTGGSTSFLGIGFNGSATMNVSGGTFSANSPLFLGNAGAGTLNLSGSAAMTLADLDFGYFAGSSTSNGTANLNGGVLTVGAIRKFGTGTGTLNLSGATIKASAANANFMSGLTAANVTGGGGTIDNGGFAISIAQPLLNSGGSPDGGLTFQGTGTTTLGGADTYTGTTTIAAGTLMSDTAGINGSDTTSGIAFAGGTLKARTSAGISTNKSITATSNILLDTTNGAITLGGAIANTTSGLTFVGGNPLTLAGTDSYTGATSIGTGILNVTGSLSGTAVTTGAGTLNVTGTLGSTAVTIGVGGVLSGSGDNLTAGLIGGTVSNSGGGSINLASADSTKALTVNSLTLGSTSAFGAGTYTTLNFALGIGGIEALDVGTAGLSTGAATVNSGGAFVSISGAIIPGTYTLMNFGSLTGMANLSLSKSAPGVTSVQIGVNTYTLTDTGTSLTLQVTGVPAPATAFFKGGAATTAWNDFASAPTTNWSTDPAGLIDAGNSPGVITDVTLNASSESVPVSMSLGADTTINSLTVNGNGADTIAAGNTLTINAMGINGHSLGDAITLNAAANAFAINAGLVMGNSGASQTWTNASSHLFTVGGSVTGTAPGGNTQILTLTNSSTGGTALNGSIGDGSAGGNVAIVVNGNSATTTLAGNNTFTGGVTIDSGAVAVGNAGALNATNPDNVTFGPSAPTGTKLQLNGNSIAVASLNSDPNPGSPVVENDNTAAAILTINNAIADTYAGVLQDGTGGGTLGLTKSGSGTLTLSGNNGFIGGVTINAGALQLGNAGALNSTTANTLTFGPSAPAGTKLQLNGNSVTVVGLKSNATPGSPIVENASSTAATLSVNNVGSSSFAGVLQDGTGGGPLTLVKSGTGTQILTGANTYSGGTTISSGVLQLGNGTVNGTVGTGYSIASGASLLLDYATAIPTGAWSNSITGAGTVELNSAQAVNATANWGQNSPTPSSFGSSFTGTLQIDNGRIDVSPAGLGGVSNIVVKSGAQFLGWSGTYTMPVTIAGTGWGETADPGALRIAANTVATWAGGITLAANSTILSQAGAAFTLTGPISGAFQALFDAQTNASFVVAPASGVQNSYASTEISDVGVVIAGNAFAFSTGALTMNAGTLELNNNSFSFADLSGTGTIGNYGTTTASTITVGSDNTSTSYGGKLIDSTTAGTASLGLTKIGTGTLTLGGVNTYSGGTIVSAGTLKATVATIGGSTPTSGSFGINSAVTVNGGATLDLNGLNETLGSLADNAGSGGVVTSTGPSAASLIVGGNNSSTSFAGTIQDGAGFVSVAKAGTGTWAISGNNTYSGGTTVSGGALLANNIAGSATGSGAIFVNGGGTLGGNGTVTSIIRVASGGNLTPGSAGVGTLNSNGVTLNSGSNFNIAISGTSGTDENVTGAVNLGGATLNVNVLSAPGANSVFTIINNDGTDAVVGNFQTSGGVVLTNGSTFTANGTSFKIFYTGGDGNDVILVEPTVPTTVYVSNSNFGLGSTPALGQVVDGDQGTAGTQSAIYGFNAVNTITAALATVPTNGTVVVNSGTYHEVPNVTSGLTGGQTLSLSGGPVTLDSLNAAFDTAISLQGNTLTVGDSSDAGVVNADFTADTGSLVKVGSDTLTLDGNESFTGTTTVSGGTLIVNSATDLSSSTSVAAGAMLGGSGNLSGSVSSLGTVAPAASGTPGTLTIAGTLNLDPSAMSSPGSLTIDLVGGGTSDLVNVTGVSSSVNLSGATLNLVASGTFNPGDTFTILTMPGGTGRRTGFFSGGSTITVGTQSFSISYAGGAGNDVVLTALGGATSPSIVSTVLNGGVSYIDSTIASKQHSMVENVVYSFGQAVNLTTANFSLTGIGGTTSAPNVALASSSGGTVWTVTFTGTGVNNATHSIGDGEYALTLSGIPELATNTYDFFRLLGDMDGNGTVDSSDFNILISSFLRGTADPAYLGADDLDGNNKVDGSDFNIFVSNFLKKLPDTTLLN